MSEVKTPIDEASYHYEKFERIDSSYKTLEKQFWKGELVESLVSGGSTIAEAMELCREMLEKAIENRNIACAEIRASLRSAVMLDKTVQRGIDGRATTINCGPFKATSATTRWLDADTLVRDCTEKGVIKDLLEAKTLDKKGNTVGIVRQVWEVDYEKTVDFLIGRGLKDVLEHAYDEKEVTPKVSGPKPIAFLGESKE